MPYDITDAMTDIAELQERYNLLISVLIEKGIIPKPEDKKHG